MSSCSGKKEAADPICVLLKYQQRFCPYGANLARFDYSTLEIELEVLQVTRAVWTIAC